MLRLHLQSNNGPNAEIVTTTPSELRHHQIAGRDIADRLAFADDVGEKFDIAFHTFEEINANGGRSCLD
jgi:hypothetical protein